ncbi:glutamate--cysteine ligase [bacterium K02(2017)]|nr:glutamate--cysteine ligase [bacterium K02(2017)]
MIGLEDLKQRLSQAFKDCDQGCSAFITRGLEKESLRVTPNGYLAQTSHPLALGSALTNPYITTDYSEALLEFVTPPLQDAQKLMSFLKHTHQFTLKNLKQEMLWPLSMPCLIKSADEIPIARYGSSNVGQMKHIYRKGLDYRYGKKMQCISGVHYNFSLSKMFWKHYQSQLNDQQSLRDFIDESYFKIIRNFDRYAWLIIYLFGSSPVVCKSFLADQKVSSDLKSLDANTFYKPFGTSLRMSDIGYKSDVQKKLNVSYNNLNDYVAGLIKAMTTVYPAYEKHGIKHGGEYMQLNTNYIQVENEYYGLIRPKRVTLEGERPTQALKRRGVEYIELRCLDVNPFSPVGVTIEQLYFIDVFILFCLMTDAPMIEDKEREQISSNHRLTVNQGRKDNLQLYKVIDGEPTTLKKWAKELFERLELVAEFMDINLAKPVYQKNMSLFKTMVEDPNETYSGQILRLLKQNKQSFFDLALELTHKHDQTLKRHEFSSKVLGRFEQTAIDSIDDQREIEASDKLTLDEYLKKFFG